MAEAREVQGITFSIGCLWLCQAALFSSFVVEGVVKVALAAAHGQPEIPWQAAAIPAGLILLSLSTIQTAIAAMQPKKPK